MGCECEVRCDLSLDPGERDMVVLQHEIDVRYAENKKVWTFQCIFYSYC